MLAHYEIEEIIQALKAPVIVERNWYPYVYVAYEASLKANKGNGVWAEFSHSDIMPGISAWANMSLARLLTILEQLKTAGILRQNPGNTAFWDFTDQFLERIGETRNTSMSLQSDGRLVYYKPDTPMLETSIKVKGQEAELKDLYFFYKNMHWFFETQPQLEHIYVGRAKLNKKEAEELHLILSQQSAFL